MWITAGAWFRSVLCSVSRGYQHPRCLAFPCARGPRMRFHSPPYPSPLFLGCHVAHCSTRISSSAKDVLKRHPPGSARQLYPELFGHRLREGDSPPISSFSVSQVPHSGPPNHHGSGGLFPVFPTLLRTLSRVALMALRPARWIGRQKSKSHITRQWCGEPAHRQAVIGITPAWHPGTPAADQCKYRSGSAESKHHSDLRPCVPISVHGRGDIPASGGSFRRRLLFSVLSLSLLSCLISFQNRVNSR